MEGGLCRVVRGWMRRGWMMRRWMMWRWVRMVCWEPVGVVHGPEVDSSVEFVR